MYCGITNNIANRMKTHASGKGSKYVKQKGFMRLLYTLQAVDKIDAAKLEYRIKQLPKNQKIEFFLHHPMLEYSSIKST